MFPLKEKISLGGVGGRSIKGQIFSTSPESSASAKVLLSSDCV